MSISVIIPVHNTEEYVSQAIESALNQKETSEVILVDDGSSDGSSEICDRWAKTVNQVHLYTHPDKINLGPAASRNLGIRKSKCNIIAFLDSDDYYMSHRFSNSLQYLINNDCLGIAEPIEVEPHESIEVQNYSSTLLEDPLKPEDVFSQLLLDGNFHISLNGVTIKREAFDKIGYFDHSLVRAEDTDLLLRIAFIKELHVLNRSRPVARYRRHNYNRQRGEKLVASSRIQFYQKWLEFASKKNLGKQILFSLLKRKIINQAILDEKSGKVHKAFQLIHYLITHPRFLLKLVLS